MERVREFLRKQWRILIMIVSLLYGIVAIVGRDVYRAERAEIQKDNPGVIVQQNLLEKEIAKINFSEVLYIGDDKFRFFSKQGGTSGHTTFKPRYSEGEVLKRCEKMLHNNGWQTVRKGKNLLIFEKDRFRAELEFWKDGLLHIDFAYIDGYMVRHEKTEYDKWFEKEVEDWTVKLRKE